MESLVLPELPEHRAFKDRQVSLDLLAPKVFKVLRALRDSREHLESMLIPRQTDLLNQLLGQQYQFKFLLDIGYNKVSMYLFQAAATMLLLLVLFLLLVFRISVILASIFRLVVLLARHLFLQAVLQALLDLQEHKDHRVFKALLVLLDSRELKARPVLLDLQAPLVLTPIQLPMVLHSPLSMLQYR